MLELDQDLELRILWEEFDICQMQEAQYTAILDRLQFLIRNYLNECGMWAQSGVTFEQVYKRNQITLNHDPKEFVDVINQVVDEWIGKGYIIDKKQKESLFIDIGFSLGKFLAFFHEVLY